MILVEEDGKGAKLQGIAADIVEAAQHNAHRRDPNVLCTCFRRSNSPALLLRAFGMEDEQVDKTTSNSRGFRSIHASPRGLGDGLLVQFIVLIIGVHHDARPLRNDGLQGGVG